MEKEEEDQVREAGGDRDRVSCPGKGMLQDGKEARSIRFRAIRDCED